VQCLLLKTINPPCKGGKFGWQSQTGGFGIFKAQFISKPLPLRVLPLTGEISAFSVFPFFKGKCRSRSGGSRKGV